MKATEKIVFAIAVMVTIGFLIVDVMSVAQRNGLAMLLNANITYVLIKLCILLYREAKGECK